MRVGLLWRVRLVICAWLVYVLNSIWDVWQTVSMQAEELGTLGAGTDVVQYFEAWRLQ